MRVEVDLDTCESQAVCVGLASAVFELDDNGVLHVLDPTPDESLRDALESAEAACPVGAITLSE